MNLKTNNNYVSESTGDKITHLAAIRSAVINLTLAGFVPAVVILFTGCTNFYDDWNSDEVRTPLPEYTASYAREWESIAPEHIPQVKFVRREGQDFIQITVPLKDATTGHYIEKIGIADKDTKADLAVVSIPRGAKKFQAEFPYTYNDNQVKVFAKCNMHDLWTVDDLGRFR